MRIAAASALFAVVLLGSVDARPAFAERWTFSGDPMGKAPAGSEAFSGSWVVRHEPGAPHGHNILCQVGRAEFPAIALGGKRYSDASVSVRFKAISGEEDRAAGIIFRIRDRDDYYILRANALENNLNLYKYEGGRRIVLKEGSVPVPSGAWQELRVEARGKSIRGYLDGKLVIDAEDATFKEGRVGLWTKADSTTCFSGFSVERGAPAR